MKTTIAMCIRNSKWRLVLFHRTMNVFAVGLALSAIVGGIYGQREYFVFALNLAGAITFARAWWEYLRHAKSAGNPRWEKPPKVPYILRKEKAQKRHLPAFLRKNDDFDDDLVAETLADEEVLEDAERAYAHIGAYLVCGILFFVFSLCV